MHTVVDRVKAHLQECRDLQSSEKNVVRPDHRNAGRHEVVRVGRSVRLWPSFLDPFVESADPVRAGSFQKQLPRGHLEGWHHLARLAFEVSREQWDGGQFQKLAYQRQCRCLS